jgi:hypothetical protein
VGVWTVLIRLAGGEGVVRRADGTMLVTDDVSGDGSGTYLREEDPYQPKKTGRVAEHSVVGGRLPPGAVSVEVVDDRGTRVAASIGNDAYAAVLAQPHDSDSPVVCCLDAAGAPVRRPLPAGYPSERVTDTTEPCPACGAVDYEECVPTEQWRGGQVNADGTTTPNPIVVCRVCGHQEPEGTFYALLDVDTADTEDEAAREARIARERAEERLQRWYSDTMTIRAVTFPIYAAEGWPAQICGSGTRGDEQISIRICHHAEREADLFEAGPPPLEVTTSQDRQWPSDELWQARQALKTWAAWDASPWPEASHAAVTLWLRGRRREARALVLDAERSEQLITVDGTPEPFLMLTARTGGWVALRRHSDLTITIAAGDLDPSSLTIEPIADPAARLLGPQPPDPDVG